MSVEDMKAWFRRDRGRPIISVHRGDWNPLPENSLAAIRSASAWDVVEIDLRLSANGEPIVVHDDTLLRTAGAGMATDGARLDDIASLRLKSGAGGVDATKTEERVPKLAEAFDALRQGTVSDLDVKRAQDVEAVAAHVASLGQGARATVKIDLAEASDISGLKALEARHGVMVMGKVVLRGPDDLDLVRRLKEADQAVIEVWYASLDILQQACKIGGESLGLSVYTLDIVHCCDMCDGRALTDPDAVWGRLRDVGVKQIMTDRPRELSSYLQTR
ncbi:MAG: glycerophosphodiester phosphodiesterase family protein [Silicimonas sp.]|nr:glycerophosphodiester phosphodiesterase family protein [Silicimonas sp.]